jgi:hypothetical protein
MLSPQQKDEIYGKYQDATNMGYSELLEWSKNPCSREASIGRTAIKRNLRLKSKNKEDWTLQDYKDANKSISYLARAKKIKSSNKVGCGYTKNEIALKNWAFDSN